MTKIKQFGRRLLTAIVSLSLFCTGMVVPVSAETTSTNYTDDYSKYAFVITLYTPNVSFTDDRDSDDGYPCRAYANDIEVSCKVGGDTAYGFLVKYGMYSRTYGFMFEADQQPTFSTPPTGTLIVDDAGEHGYSLTETDLSKMDWYNPTITITKEDSRWAEEYAKLDDEFKQYADDSGSINTVNTQLWQTLTELTIVDNVGLGFSIYDGSYGTKPNFISTAVLYDGDTKVADGTVSEGYKIKFDTPLDFTKTYTVKFLYFNSNQDYTPWLGEMKWKPARLSTPVTEHHLMTDIWWSLGNAIPNDDSTTEDLFFDDEDDEIIFTETTGLYDSEFRITIESELEKYNTVVSSLDTTIALSGTATEAFVENNDRIDAKVGDTVVWERFNADRTTGVQAFVEAGTYTLTGSDQLNVSYSGDLKIGDNETKDIEVKVAPKYTLNITSKAGTVNCTVNGYSVSDVESQDFALIGNEGYTVVDSDSGKAYSIKATDAEAHLKLVLGEDGYLIADGANTGDEELATEGIGSSSESDTPNTFTDDSGDKAADVQVVAKPNVIPKEAHFSVKLDDSSTAERVAYNCFFTYNGAEYEPTETVTVRIPVPVAMRDIADTLKVYHLQDGKYVNMSAKVEDGYLVFDTDHFSVYVVTADNLANEGSSDSSSNPVTPNKDNLANEGSPDNSSNPVTPNKDNLANEGSSDSSSDPVTPNKDNPDTGVPALAAAGGILALAGAAVLAARKKRR